MNGDHKIVINGDHKAITYRPHRPGDMGLITARHGQIYHAHYGWGAPFEALVARICADFLDNLDPTRERCWIAERDGDFLGSVFLVKDTEPPATLTTPRENTARLRVLLVEPSARGLGIGKGLVGRAVEFAREVGYERVVLFTQSLLTPAKRLYASFGFQMVGEKEEVDVFATEGRTQVWELELGTTLLN